MTNDTPHHKPSLGEQLVDALREANSATPLPPTAPTQEASSNAPHPPENSAMEIPSDTVSHTPGGEADPNIPKPLDNQSLPLFLQADKPETWDKPPGTTWGDHFLSPHRPLSPRHKELARLLFMGKKTGEIADLLGYTEARVSVLKSNTKIQQEVERLAEKAFEKTVGERLNDMGGIAADTIEEILSDPNEKASLRADTARWVLEKLSGKPGQQIEVKATTLNVFLHMLEQAKQSGTVIDVAPPRLTQSESGSLTAEEVVEDVNKFAQWVDTET